MYRTSHAPEERDDRWCVGLRAVRDRPLESEEREALRGLRRTLWRRGAALGLAGLALPLASVAIARVPAPWGTLLLPLAVVSTVLLGLPVFLLMAQDRVLRARALSRDLQAGTLERFEGTTGPTIEPLRQRLVAARLLSPREDEPQSVDVLPQAKAVFRVNGKHVRRWYAARVAACAPHPESVLCVPLPPDVPIAPSPHLLVRRRLLSRAENRELDAHVARLRKLPLGARAASLLLGLALAIWFLVPAAHTSLHAALLGATASAALLAYAGHLRRHLRARRLDRDRRLGWVVTVEPRPAPGRTTAPARSETLAVSRAPWSDGGKPAPWRLGE